MRKIKEIRITSIRINTIYHSFLVVYNFSNIRWISYIIGKNLKKCNRHNTTSILPADISLHFDLCEIIDSLLWWIFLDLFCIVKHDVVCRTSWLLISLWHLARDHFVHCCVWHKINGKNKHFFISFHCEWKVYVNIWNMWDQQLWDWILIFHPAMPSVLLSKYSTVLLLPSMGLQT